MKMRLFERENKTNLDASVLEKEINAWLEQNPGIKIIDIKQSSNGGSFASSKVFISIWYE